MFAFVHYVQMPASLRGGAKPPAESMVCVDSFVALAMVGGRVRGWVGLLVWEP